MERCPEGARGQEKVNRTCPDWSWFLLPRDAALATKGKVQVGGSPVQGLVTPNPHVSAVEQRPRWIFEGGEVGRCLGRYLSHPRNPPGRHRFDTGSRASANGGSRQGSSGKQRSIRGFQCRRQCRERGHGVHVSDVTPRDGAGPRSSCSDCNYGARSSCLMWRDVGRDRDGTEQGRLQ